MRVFSSLYCGSFYQNFKTPFLEIAELEFMPADILLILALNLVGNFVLGWPRFKSMHFNLPLVFTMHMLSFPQLNCFMLKSSFEISIL